VVSPIRVLILGGPSCDTESVLVHIRRAGFDPTAEPIRDAASLRAMLASAHWDVVLADDNASGMEAFAALALVRMTDPLLPFVIVADAPDVSAVVEFMRAGANDYVPKDDLARLGPSLVRLVGEAAERRDRRFVELENEGLVALVRSADDAVIGKDLAGTIQSWNRAAERMYGWKASEVIGQPIGLIVPNDRKDELAAIMRRVHGGESIDHFETVRVRKDGVRVDVSLIISPIRDHAGRLVGASKIVRDISERKHVEAALRETMLRFQAIFHSQFQFTGLLDLTGTIIEVNRSALAAGGISADEAVGKLVWETPWLDHDAVQQEHVRDAVFRAAAGEQVRFEATYRGQGGSIRWVDLVLTPFRNDAGAITMVIPEGRDVTDRKNVEASLQASERRFRAFMDNLPAAAWVLDRNSRVVFVNRHYGVMAGVDPDWLTGKTAYDIYPDQIAAQHQSNDRRVLATNKALETTETYVRPDGSLGEVLCVKFPISVRDEQFLMGGVAIDVTERARLQTELLMRDRAIQAVHQGIVITDPSQADNPIVYASPGFERMTGYSTNDARGRNCRFLQGPDTDIAELARIRESIQAQQPITVELLNYRRDGTSFWNELSITPVRDPAGRLVHFVGVQADVTARRKLQDQLRQAQKMEAVGQLAGGIAHDFNNLLTVINGFSELALSQAPPEHAFREPLEAVWDAGKRAADITKQLLAFSRRAIVAPRVLDLNQAVESIAKLLRRLIGADIALSLVLDPNPCPVLFDLGQFEQVIVNLAVNARDAMPAGGKLTIETASNVDASPELLGPAGCVQLTVTDTGNGIADDVKDRIFEPFFTTKAVGQGAGLGLATVYGIVLQAGGHIDVESALGRGSAFTLLFPKVDATTTTSAPEASVQFSPRGTETILIAEDERPVRRLARLALESHGYKVLEAASGEQARSIVESYSGPIDLLVTDVVMPGLGGRGLAEAALSCRPSLRILFISGYTDDALIRLGAETSTNTFLQKPFSPSDLAQAVRRILEAGRNR